MKYEWNPEKNTQLKKERNISFEQIIFHLSHGDLWKIADHPNQEKYSRQKLYFVVIEEYVYIIPHVVTKDYIFLKTIIPSRKATRMYRTEQEEQNEI
ncbi:MAG: toxin [Candidatus Electrothrix sp. AR4]|nr:toxin [Candidatus Electrothrix sp. AR4]